MTCHVIVHVMLKCHVISKGLFGSYEKSMYSVIPPADMYRGICHVHLCPCSAKHGICIGSLAHVSLAYNVD